MPACSLHSCPRKIPNAAHGSLTLSQEDSMMVKEIMTKEVKGIQSDKTLLDAAKEMSENDIGALAVFEGERIRGIVTDRDIIIRGMSLGLNLATDSVDTVMSSSVVSVSEDSDADEAVRMMEEKQLRRIPVRGKDDRIRGIISLGDIALHTNRRISGEALQEISKGAKVGPVGASVKVKEVMTRNASTIQSSDAVKHAAEMMDSLNVGAIPVFDGDRESGMITDRDIVVRCIASELNPLHTSVGEIMSKGVKSISEEAAVEEALRMMEQFQIRRLLVKDRGGAVVGIVSLGNLALSVSKELAGEAIHDVSEHT
ncbi:MAG: CBS domain-containing protein [Chitinivibrionales bacterium]|nr:CBS domain-containing protein [Chitinivibrionales bacterium]